MAGGRGNLGSHMLAPVLVVLPLLFGASPESAPSFLNLPAEDDNSWLNMTCEGEPGLERLTCHFVSTSVRKPAEAAVAAAVEKVKSAVLAKEGASEMKKLCANFTSKKVQTTFEKSQRSGSPERRAASRQDQELWGAICRCAENDKACLVDALGKAVEAEERTCRVFTNEFQMEFTRAGKDKWISNPGPKGACNLVMVTVIERDKEHSNLWTYTQTRLSADSDTELCASLFKDGISLNVPLRHSWNASNTSLVNCERVKPGF